METWRVGTWLRGGMGLDGGSESSFLPKRFYSLKHQWDGDVPVNPQ